MTYKGTVLLGRVVVLSMVKYFTYRAVAFLLVLFCLPAYAIIVITPAPLSPIENQTFNISWTGQVNEAETYLLQMQFNGGPYTTLGGTGPQPQGGVISYNAGSTHQIRSAGVYRYRWLRCNVTPCADHAITLSDIVVRPAPPGTPGQFAANVNGNSVNLSWNASKGIVDTYEVEREVYNSNVWQPVITLNNSTLSYVDNPVDGQWRYRIHGCNTGGCSNWATAGPVTVIATPPGIPQNFQVVANGENVNIAWTAPTGTVTGYEIDRKLSSAPVWPLTPVLTEPFGTVSTIDVPSPGAWDYRMRACNVDACSDYTEVESIQVSLPGSGPDTPNPPIANPNPSIDSTSSTIGAIKAQFRVNEVGAATYTIPMTTAPAGGGMAPSLSLDYSSQGGNGIAGMGWSLGGVSMIARCGKSIESGDGQNNGVTLTDEDRFCLDGQRLLLVSGTGAYGSNGAQYRTEIDSLVRVQSMDAAGSGPAWFKVWRPDGTISWHGAISDTGAVHGSRISSKLTDGTVFAWAVGRIQDSAGNYMDFEWQDQHAASTSVETMLAGVQYGGHIAAPALSTNNEISLVYATRPATEQSLRYTAGMEMVTTRRLSQIISRGDGLELRRYNLTYRSSGDGVGRSALESLQECNGSVCYPATSFRWLAGNLTLGTLSTTAGAEVSISNANRIVSQQLVDINGDGLADYLWLQRQSGSSAPQFKWLLSQRNAAGGISFGTLVTGPVMGGGISSGANSFPEWRLLDVNGDGYNDIIYGYDNSSNGSRNFYAHIWATSGYGAATIVGTFSGSVNQLLAMDWDGDGQTDLLYGTGLFSEFGSDAMRIARHMGYNAGNPAVTFVEAVSLPVLLDVAHFPVTPGPSVLGLRRFRFADDQVFDANGDGWADVVLQVSEEYCLPGCIPPIPPSSGSLDPGDEGSQAQGNTAWQSRYILFEMQQDSTTGIYRLSSRQALARAGNDQAGGIPSSIADRIRIADLNGDALGDAVYFSSNLNRWEYLLNRGDSFAPVTAINHWPSDSNRRQHLQLTDINGDGHPDALFPSVHDSESAVWQVSLWDWSASATANYGPLTSSSAGTGNLLQGAGSRFADINGDGKTDQLHLKLSGTSLQLRRSYGRNGANSSYEALFVIDRFTDGFGAWNEARYRSLTQRQVYTRDRQGPYPAYGLGSTVYDIVPPQYVINEARSLSPHYEVNAEGNGSTAFANGEAIIQYYYTGAKLQGGGRGFLGFREVATFDPQNSVLTRTQYRQDYPFIGKPENTKRWYLPLTTNPWKYDDAAVAVGPCAGCVNDAINSGVILSDSQNTYNAISTQGDAVYPYVNITEEKSYTPVVSKGAISGSTLTGRVATTNSNLDSYGNVQDIQVDTYTATNSLLLRQKTVSQYTNTVNSTLWHLGRLSTSTVEHDRRAGACTPTQFASGTDSLCIRRQSSFGYQAGTGILNKETVEPNDASLRVVTDYVIDTFGNRRQTTVSGLGITTRSSSVTYDSPRGRYITTRSNAYGQTTEQVLSFDSFGNPLQIRDLAGVDTVVKYDSMGREYFRYSDTGAWIKQILRNGPGTICPSGTAYYRETTAGGAPTSWTCFDALGRENRRAEIALNNQRRQTDTHYDESSRVAELSEPYYSGQAVYWTRTLYDELGRPLQIFHPDGGVSEQSYIGMTVTSINPLDQHRDEARNALGERVSVIDYDGAAVSGVISYSYDAVGNLLSTDGVMSSDTVTMTYDSAGRKLSTNDPDKGLWQYRYDVLGQLSCQQDAKSQLIKYSYDLLGRETLRQHYDSGSVTTCTGNGVATATSGWTYNNTSGSGGSRGQLTADTASHDGFMQNRSYVYDAFGRLDTVSTNMDGRVWEEESVYDEFGRVFQQFDAAGSELGVRYGVRFVYHSNGHLSQLREAAQGASGRVYLTFQNQDARGQINQLQYANGLTTWRGYDPETGRLESIVTGVNVQNLSYQWDFVGNLEQRHDQSLGRNQLEDFVYDGLNRLESVHLTAPNLGVSHLQTLGMRYNAAGNILCKSDVGSSPVNCQTVTNYQYTNGRPHAVSSVNGTSYLYDTNGNVSLDSSGRSFTYTAFDRLLQAIKGANWSRYFYGPDLSWVKRETLGDDAATATFETLWRVGNVEISEKNGIRELRRTIGGEVQVSHWAGNPVARERYLHKDHLGSIDTVTDASGQLVDAMSFGAFGARRGVADWRFSLTLVQIDNLRTITSKGYTGHEMADAVGIIHMGGRIYDPQIGRFLQADLFIQAPANSQSLNRYSYVLNNSLSYTDPSGFFFKSLFKVFKIAAAIAISVYSGGVGAGLFSFGSISGGLAGLGIAAAGGALSGFISGGGIKGALVGAFSGFIFGGLGQQFAAVSSGIGTGFLGSGLNPGNFLAAAVSSGFVGGVLSKIQGGRFGHGLLSAGLPNLISPVLGRIKDVLARGVVSSIVGGGLSKITGGKFGNGVLSAAFSSLASAVSSHLQPPDTLPQDGDIVVGLDGAGSDDFRDNVRIQKLGVDLGGKVFDARAVVGSPIGVAKDYILAQLDLNPEARVYIFGYSAGGHAAINLAWRLNELGISVQGLVTFDPHNPIGLFGASKFNLPSNVVSALNFFQQKPAFPFGTNPFQGGTLSCGSCNINLGGDPSIVHTNIVRRSLNGFGHEIKKTLGN